MEGTAPLVLPVSGSVKPTAHAPAAIHGPSPLPCLAQPGHLSALSQHPLPAPQPLAELVDAEPTSRTQAVCKVTWLGQEPGTLQALVTGALAPPPAGSSATAVVPGAGAGMTAGVGTKVGAGAGAGVGVGVGVGSVLSASLPQPIIPSPVLVPEIPLAQGQAQPQAQAQMQPQAQPQAKVQARAQFQPQPLPLAQAQMQPQQQPPALPLAQAPAQAHAPPQPQALPHSLRAPSAKVLAQAQALAQAKAQAQAFFKAPPQAPPHPQSKAPPQTQALAQSQPGTHSAQVLAPNLISHALSTLPSPLTGTNGSLSLHSLPIQAQVAATTISRVLLVSRVTLHA